MLGKRITKISRVMDNLACGGIVATMILVVLNVILRRIFNSPIRGVYEYVGYLTAAIVGLAIAFCALQNAHIAVGFIVEKLNIKKQKIIQRMTGSIMTVFLLFVGIQMIRYAGKVAASGEVSTTAHMPFYPFIIIVAAGLLMLSLVEMSKVLKGVMDK